MDLFKLFRGPFVKPAPGGIPEIPLFDGFRKAGGNLRRVARFGKKHFTDGGEDMGPSEVRRLDRSGHGKSSPNPNFTALSTSWVTGTSSRLWKLPPSRNGRMACHARTSSLLYIRICWNYDLYLEGFSKERTCVR